MSQVLIITGFGPFAGVERNPTQEIVEELQLNWTCIHNGTDSTQPIPIFYVTVEVSVEGCEAFFAQIAERYPSAEITFVHLGVDARGTHIKLEEFAYNNMSFRVPDQRNFRPEGKAIQPALAYDLPLQTCWNIPTLIRNLTLQETSVGHDNRHEIDASTDPGRFLCNYIYFRSMLFRPCCSSRSIFVHVPLFEYISKDKQVKIVKSLATDMVLNYSTFDRNIAVVTEAPVEASQEGV